MSELNQELQTAFQAISLILVFVTVLFGMRYPQIQRDIHTPRPAGTDARKQYKTMLHQSILFNCGPVLIVNVAATWLFLPLLAQVFRESEITAWNFDFSRTAFAFIATLIFTFLLWSGYLAIRLLMRLGATMR